VKLALGKFACFCIETRFGADLQAGVQAALRHYTRRLKSAGRPADVPSFGRDQVPDGSGAEFELDVDPGIQEMLEREARDQSVDVEQLLIHAVFVYLADLDASSFDGLGPSNQALSA
jgi:hypothetical protein